MNDLPTADTILRNLLVIENFVDAPTCRALVAVHQQFGTLTSASDNGFSVADMRECAPATFQSARAIIGRITTLIRNTYQAQVGCELALICALSGAFRHTLHADNAMVVCPRHGNNAEQLVERGCQCDDIEVHPNHTPWRKYTALLYLESDHAGGNIVFGDGPNVYGRLYHKDIEVKQGLLVLSPSNEQYFHRTTPVLRGVRYSLNMWFATDPAYLAREWT